jgi:hypothetical protein
MTKGIVLAANRGEDAFGPVVTINSIRTSDLITPSHLIDSYLRVTMDVQKISFNIASNVQKSST